MSGVKSPVASRPGIDAAGQREAGHALRPRGRRRRARPTCPRRPSPRCRPSAISRSSSAASSMWAATLSAFVAHRPSRRHGPTSRRSPPGGSRTRRGRATIAPVSPATTSMVSERHAELRRRTTWASVVCSALALVGRAGVDARLARTAARAPSRPRTARGPVPST